MMQEFYKELLDYSHQMNQKLITVFAERSADVSEKSIKLISHILNAHQIWNNRIDQQQEPYSVWQIHSLAHLKDIDHSNLAATTSILDKTDLAKIIQYTNSQGKFFSNSVKDILFHAINHSTYHRAQIATEFKQSGLDPIITDYIFYKSE